MFDSAAALVAAAFARQVYQRLMHQARGDGEEMPAVFQPHLAGVNQPQISFVDKRRGLQRMAGAFAAHLLFRKPAQFAVNQWYQLIHRRLITIAPGQEQLGNFVWVWLWHLIVTPDWRSLRKNLHACCSFSPQFPHGLVRRKVEFAPSESVWRRNHIARQPLHFNRYYPNRLVIGENRV